MRRFVWLLILVCWCCLTLTGCGLMAAIMGTTPETKDAPPINSVIGFLQTIPGIGTAVAAGLGMARWAWVEKAHYDLIKAGKKDDNNNGVDDAIETTTTTTTKTT